MSRLKGAGPEKDPDDLILLPAAGRCGRPARARLLALSAGARLGTLCPVRQEPRPQRLHRGHGHAAAGSQDLVHKLSPAPVVDNGQGERPARNGPEAVPDTLRQTGTPGPSLHARRICWLGPPYFFEGPAADQETRDRCHLCDLQAVQFRPDRSAAQIRHGKAAGARFPRSGIT